MKNNIIILIFIIIFSSCFNNDEEKILNGVFSFEQNKGKTLLLVDNKLANGIVKGHDDILNLEYEMKYKKGLPTGEIIFLNQGQKFIELNMQFNFTNHEAKGNIKIFDIDRDGNIVVNMEYNNIVSTIENFINLKKMKPNLNWYVDNPLNVYKNVDTTSYGKKISSIKNGKYLFYDDEGQEIELSMKANNENNNEILNEFVDQVAYEDIETTDPNTQLIYEDTDYNVKKLKVDGLLLTGTLSTTDSNFNQYEIAYSSGLPSGFFEIKNSVNKKNISANGKYDFSNNIWSGEIEIKNESNDILIKNVIIDGNDLFHKNNEIVYDVIEFSFEKEELSKQIEQSIFKNADFYLNKEFIESIKK